MRGKGKPSGKDKPTGCMAFFVSLGRSVNQRLASARNALRKKFRRNNNDVRPLTPDELENETGTPDLVFTLKSVGPVKAERMRKSSSVELALESNSQREVSEECAVKPVEPTVSTPNEKADVRIDPFKDQVKNYINNIIQNAIIIVKAEDDAKDQRESESLTSSVLSEIAELAVSDSLSKIVAASTDNTNRDTVVIDKSGTSIASSKISQIAELAVSDSLSKIAALSVDNDNNIRNSVVIDRSATSIASSEISQIAELAVSDSLSRIASTSERNDNANARRPRCVGEMLEYHGIKPLYNADGMPRVDV